jgi:hypothetical protein
MSREGLGLSVQILVRDDLIYDVPCHHTVGRHQLAQLCLARPRVREFENGQRLLVYVHPAITPCCIVD